ncbi:hydantoinase B/oxoprolinase family protein [Cohnella thailandensis]|uniref:Hydantoinase B/oxoprolinase family protein n=1 Tax=Cohnella thailandensis TaxID=557557 RepID=A0A841T6P2_9BACL|nr:hydantoinase B/oxoprolinase family protein [Cohnella thailandensis]MBB6637527.1 hydantoinase B/oxoprolinase family protein [Cohnella thailandensis]MBP1977560.1 N-methylhydantoinase B [Cohnella thailandensis]
MPSRNRIEDQIIYSKIAAANRHAGEQLQRISRSSIIAEARAYAVGTLTPTGGLAHQVQGQAEHLFALRSSARAIFDRFAFDIEEGDVLITGDVFGGGTKGQMLTMVLPFFIDGELAFTPAIRAQMTDLAGEYPGGYHPEAFETWQESMRITPTKLYTGGKLRRDVLRFLLANSRTPDILSSDLDAMLASLRQAQSSLRAIVNAYGVPRVAEAVERMTTHTAARTLEAIPFGSELSFAGQAAVKAGAQEIEVRVRLHRQDARLFFDFAGSSAQVEAPFNSSPETVKACAVIALMGNQLNELPINDGLLDAYSFEMPAGSIVNPEFPAATSLGFETSGQAAAAAVTSALNEGAGQQEKFAKVGGMAPLTVLYSPLGSREQTSILFLEPGFSSAEGVSGPPSLLGGRRLVSAEELERRDGLRMTGRELAEDGTMQVRIEVLKGEWEATLFAPEGAERAEEMISAERDGRRWQGTVAGLSVLPGTVIQYSYGSGVSKKDREGEAR